MELEIRGIGEEAQPTVSRKERSIVDDHDGLVEFVIFKIKKMLCRFSDDF